MSVTDPTPPLDVAAIAETARQLTAAAVQLDQIEHQRALAALRATDGWTGRHRREFDGTFRQLQATAAGIGDDLRRLAARCNQAIVDERHRERLVQINS